MPTKRASPKRVTKAPKRSTKRSYKKPVKKRSQKKRSQAKRASTKKRSKRRSKKKSVKRKLQRGGAKEHFMTDAQQKQYYKFMRAPMEGQMDKFLPSAKRLMDNHGLSLKDSLYIAVAEKYYPKEAKKYFDTVENLVYGGMKVKNAAEYALEQYMKFYKELNSPQKGLVKIHSTKDKSKLGSILRSTFF